MRWHLRNICSMQVLKRDEVSISMLLLDDQEVLYQYNQSAWIAPLAKIDEQIHMIESIIHRTSVQAWDFQEDLHRHFMTMKRNLLNEALERQTNSPHHSFEDLSIPTSISNQSQNPQKKEKHSFMKSIILFFELLKSKIHLMIMALFNLLKPQQSKEENKTPINFLTP